MWIFRRFTLWRCDVEIKITHGNTGSGAGELFSCLITPWLWNESQHKINHHLASELSNRLGVGTWDTDDNMISLKIHI